MLTTGLLLLWGAVTALDLVSAPQLLLGRPVVAGTVAGALLGDVATGVRVGAVLELYALDVLPVGASRYPDYGPATVGAVAAAAHAPWELAIGVAGLLALGLASLGGASIVWLRRLNARAVAAAAPALAAGEPAAAARLQWGGGLRDLARGALLTALGLGLAALVPWLPLSQPTATLLGALVVGGGLAAAIGGAWRRGGRRWLALGVATAAVALLGGGRG